MSIYRKLTNIYHIIVCPRKISNKKVNFII